MATVVISLILLVVVGFAIKHVTSKKSSCHCDGCSGDCSVHKTK